MKKGLKILATGGIIAAGLLTQGNVNALTDITYNVNVYKKYDVITDEDTIVLPETKIFEEDKDKNGNGYKLDIKKIRTSAETLANLKNSVATYNPSTYEFSSKCGISVDTQMRDEKTGEPIITYNSVLLKQDGSIEEDYNSLINKEYLVRIAEYSMLNKSKKASILDYQKKLETAITDYDKTKYSTILRNYQDDVVRMDQLTLTDIPTAKPVYNAIMASNVVAATTSAFSGSTGAHISDTVNIRYHYYVILVRDLRLSKLQYKVDSGSFVDVPKFDKDTKTYNVYLEPNTAKNATIVTSSVGLQSEDDKNRKYVYDNGITIEEGNVTLNNGVGTTKVKVKFDGTKYGKTEDYVKEYTLNFSILDYRKGDVNKDGFIDSTDAAIVLDLFKNGGATEENFKFGDMNNDNQLNSTDAAMILDIFKSSNN